MRPENAGANKAARGVGHTGPVTRHRYGVNRNPSRASPAVSCDGGSQNNAGEKGEIEEPTRAKRYGTTYNTNTGRLTTEMFEAVMFALGQKLEAIG